MQEVFFLYNLLLSCILIVSNTDDDFVKAKKWIYMCVKNDEGKKQTDDEDGANIHQSYTIDYIVFNENLQF